MIIERLFKHVKGELEVTDPSFVSSHGCFNRFEACAEIQNVSWMLVLMLYLENPKAFSF